MKGSRRSYSRNEVSRENLNALRRHSNSLTLAGCQSTFGRPAGSSRIGVRRVALSRPAVVLRVFHRCAGLRAPSETPLFADVLENRTSGATVDMIATVLPSPVTRRSTNESLYSLKTSLVIM